MKAGKDQSDNVNSILERLRQPALWLVVLVLAATIILAVLDIKASSDPPYLILTLNILLVGVPCIFFSGIAAISFLRSGVWPALWLGGGSLAFGLAVFLSGLMQQFATTNATITAHNISTLLGGVLFLAGAFFVINRLPAQEEKNRRRSTLLQIYIPLLVFVAAITVLSLLDLLPPFFIQGKGGTPVRQMVLITDTVLFILSSLIIFREYLRLKSGLLFWYALALLLTGLGLVGFLMQTKTGSPLNWMGRSAEILGGLYFLMAALVTFREARARQVSAAEAMASFFAEPEASFELLVNTSGDAIISTDQKGRVLSWNQAAARMLGYNEKEALELTLTELFTPDHADYFHGELKKLGQTSPGEVIVRGTPQEKEEFLMKSKAGQTFPVTFSFSARKTPSGWVTVLVMRDISERKKAEEALVKSYDEQEMKVQARTREIVETNKALTGEIAARLLSEEAVKVERRRLNEVLETLPVYVILLNSDYHVPFANRFFRERFGESHGKRCFEYLFGRNEPCEICETYTVLKTKAPHHWEWTGPDNRNYDIYDFPFTDTDGSNLIMEMGIDITEQKLAQKALQKAQTELEERVQERTRELSETRDYLDNLFNYANAPIIVWNPDFEITRFNHAFERLTGRTAGEVLGRKLDILFPDASREASMDLIRKTAEGERWEVVEIPIIHRSGEVNIVLWNSATLYASDGKTAIATIAQGQDITPRKAAETAILQVNERLEMAYDAAEAGAWDWDVKSGRLQWTPKMFELLGLDPLQTTASFDTWENILHPEDREQAALKIQQALKEHKTLESEYRIIRGDGQIRWILAVGQGKYDEQGQAMRMIGICTDITERKKIQEDLKRYNLELEASNKELEAFSYSVSHDLRAPLRSMEGFSSALLEDYSDKLDEQGKLYLKYIQDSSDLMARLIDDLLKLSRVTRSEMNYDRIDLGEIARKIIGEFTKAEPQRQVQAVIAGDIVAYGDRNLLRLALENLLGNAWKFSSKAASPRIEVGFGEHNGRQAYFVRDNGVGFDMAYYDQLFKPFQRLHKASEFAGTGIGLATVQRIIRRHGGEVWAESKVGEGATFYFTLS
jgi:PAS domain S-box-containing protein